MSSAVLVCLSNFPERFLTFGVRIMLQYVSFCCVWRLKDRKLFCFYVHLRVGWPTPPPKDSESLRFYVICIARALAFVGWDTHHTAQNLCACSSSGWWVVWVTDYDTTQLRRCCCPHLCALLWCVTYGWYSAALDCCVRRLPTVMRLDDGIVTTA